MSVFVDHCLSGDADLDVLWRRDGPSPRILRSFGEKSRKSTYCGGADGGRDRLRAVETAPVLVNATIRDFAGPPAESIDERSRRDELGSH